MTERAECGGGTRLLRHRIDGDEHGSDSIAVELPLMQRLTSLVSAGLVGEGEAGGQHIGCDGMGRVGLGAGRVGRVGVVGWDQGRIRVVWGGAV